MSEASNPLASVSEGVFSETRQRLQAVSPDDGKYFSAKEANRSRGRLVEVALRDPEFASLFETLTPEKRGILTGNLSLYTGNSHERAEINRNYARSVTASGN